jgi:putative oxidoreductase
LNANFPGKRYLPLWKCVKEKKGTLAMIQTPLKRSWLLVGRILLILATLVVALVIGSAAVPKLMNAASQVEAFARWGYPHWFVFVIGALETSGVLLLLVSLFVRRLALPGALLLTVDMGGAMATRIVHADWQNVPLPCFLLALAILLGWAGRKSWYRPRTPLVTAN